MTYSHRVCCGWLLLLLWDCLTYSIVLLDVQGGGDTHMQCSIAFNN